VLAVRDDRLRASEHNTGQAPEFPACGCKRQFFSVHVDQERQRGYLANRGANQAFRKALAAVHGPCADLLGDSPHARYRSDVLRGAAQRADTPRREVERDAFDRQPCLSIERLVAGSRACHKMHFVAEASIELEQPLSAASAARGKNLGEDEDFHADRPVTTASYSPTSSLTDSRTSNLAALARARSAAR